MQRQAKRPASVSLVSRVLTFSAGSSMPFSSFRMGQSFFTCGTYSRVAGSMARKVFLPFSSLGPFLKKPCFTLLPNSLLSSIHWRNSGNLKTSRTSSFGHRS